MEIEGRTAIVTGAGAGAGREIALRLASEGPPCAAPDAVVRFVQDDTLAGRVMVLLEGRSQKLLEAA